MYFCTSRAVMLRAHSCLASLPTRKRTQVDPEAHNLHMLRKVRSGNQLQGNEGQEFFLHKGI